MYSVNNIRNRLEQKKGEKNQLLTELHKAKKNVRYYRKEVKISEKAQAIIQTEAKRTQEEIEYKLSELITLSMEAILDEPYQFLVKFVIRRSKTECDLYFLKDKELFDPMEESGGGVIDIAAFALQIALLNLSEPKIRGVVITDEPFKHLSKDHHEKASVVLGELSRRMDPKLQIIMITHSRELIGNTDKVFIIRRRNKRSIIKGSR